MRESTDVWGRVRRKGLIVSLTYRVIVLPILPGPTLTLRSRRVHLCSLFGAPLVPLFRPSHPTSASIPAAQTGSTYAVIIPAQVQSGHHLTWACLELVSIPAWAPLEPTLCLTFVTRKCQGANPHGTIFHQWAPEANGRLCAPLVLRCVP